MLPAEIQLLYAYNEWATAKVLEAAQQAGPEAFTAPAGLSHGSLRGTLVHILAAEQVWRLRCQAGRFPSALLKEEEFSTLADLRQSWGAEMEAMRAYVAGLDEAALGRSVPYQSTRGVAYQNLLWQLLLHVVNHGTQFRAEAAVALTRLGHSPGDLDLLGYIR